MERDTLTVEQTGQLLGLGRVSAYKAVQRGDIPALRIGGKWLVPKTAIERMLGRESSRQEVTAR